MGFRAANKAHALAPNHHLQVHAATSVRNAIAGVGTHASDDKTPYKTHQGAYVAVGPSTGWYVEISPRGLRTGAGFYEASGTRLAAYREAVAHERFGPELEAVVAQLQREGFEVGGDRLKTTPRGFDADHPRIELLRHKSLTLGRSHGFGPEIHTAAALDLVRDDWRSLRPLVEWAQRHCQD